MKNSKSLILPKKIHMPLGVKHYMQRDSDLPLCERIIIHEMKKIIEKMMDPSDFKTMSKKTLILLNVKMLFEQYLDDEPVDKEKKEGPGSEPEKATLRSTLTLTSTLCSSLSSACSTSSSTLCSSSSSTLCSSSSPTCSTSICSTFPTVDKEKKDGKSKPEVADKINQKILEARKVLALKLENRKKLENKNHAQHMTPKVDSKSDTAKEKEDENDEDDEDDEEHDEDEDEDEDGDKVGDKVDRKVEPKVAAGAKEEGAERKVSPRPAGYERHMSEDENIARRLASEEARLHAFSVAKDEKLAQRIAANDARQHEFLPTAPPPPFTEGFPPFAGAAQPFAGAPHSFPEVLYFPDAPQPFAVILPPFAGAGAGAGALYPDVAIDFEEKKSRDMMEADALQNALEISRQETDKKIMEKFSSSPNVEEVLKYVSDLSCGTKSVDCKCVPCAKLRNHVKSLVCPVCLLPPGSNGIIYLFWCGEHHICYDCLITYSGSKSLEIIDCPLCRIKMSTYKDLMNKFIKKTGQ